MNRRPLKQFFGLTSCVAVCLLSIPAAAVQLSGSLGVHDPSRILKENGRYYLYGTGSPGSPIQQKYSVNFTVWQNGPAIFGGGIPNWALAELLPSVPTNMWAPDVFYFNGEYRMYYSVSTFGSRNSVIGLATNTTLDFNDPNYAWVDREMVIESENGPINQNPFNAIDAAIFYEDDTSRMWMTWGSFSRGIYITELDPATGKRISPNSATINLARRASGSAIEAPYLTKHDDYYYLFVNWDSCCNGISSTYNIRVGRSSSPTGPFVDKTGVEMLSGGGTLLIGTEGSVIGPGHFAEFSENGRNYFGYHFYDGMDGGAPKLAIEEFYWGHDGWPLRAVDSPAGDYNRDGVVNAADYTVWRDTLGSTTDLRANGNNVRGSVGVIDQADYLVWLANFGSSGLGAGSAQAAGEPVPEPASLVWIAIAMLILWRRQLPVCR